MATAKAYILIETAIGQVRTVANAVKAVPGVVSADSVSGPYDVIALIEAEDLKSVGDVVTGQIHTIGGIVRTVTCLAVN